MGGGGRVAFHDLPEDQFPFTIAFLRHGTEEVLHEVVVTGPGAVKIPGFAPVKVDVVITGPDGSFERRNADES